MEKRLFLLFFFSLLLFCLASTVYAHASPVNYVPDSSSLLNKTPEEIAITFSERIEESSSTIYVVGPSGVSEGQQSKVDEENRYVLRAPVKNGPKGTYTVLWSVVSADDGHFTKGSYVFFVGEKNGTIAPSVDIVYSSPLLETFAVGLELLGLALIIGLLFITLTRKRIFNENRALLFTGILCILAGSFSYILIKSWYLHTNQEISLLSSIIIFLSTKTGMAALGRMILGGLLLLMYFHGKAKKKEIMSPLIILVVVGAMVFLRTVSSHASATTFYPTLSIIIHAIHLFAKELWMGSILIVTIGLLFSKGHKDKFLFEWYKSLIPGMFIVSLTGLYIVWLDLKDFSNLLVTDWGIRCIILLVLTGVLMAIQLMHGYLKTKSSTTKILLIAQSLLAIAIIFSTALIMITTPPLQRHWFHEEKVDQGVLITLKDDPKAGNALLISFEDEKSHKKIEIEKLIPLLTNEDGQISHAVPMGQTVNEWFVLPKVHLSLDGLWTVKVVGQRKNQYDVMAEFSIHSPEDLEASIIVERILDTFTKTVITFAFGLILFFGCVWFIFKKKRKEANRWFYKS